ncbi:MAG: ExeA family protein [Candidatus Rokuibacteriota bacterium]
MYTAHFGLKESPFSISPDPKFLYMSSRHREALAHLLYGISGGGGFVQLTGEVGTGKTTICRYLLEQLPPDVDVALILNPKVTALELLGTVCDELRIPYPPGTTSMKVLVDALYRHLLGAHARARRTVLIIDEAQNLTVEVLEQIRLLTNLETTREKLLQIILIGQPELSQMLESQELRQLAQRVTARYHLLPFSSPETRGYVLHRMEVAGQREVAFSEAAIHEVHRRSGGVPRLINVICDRALLGAYAHDQRRIDARTVRLAAGEVLGRTVRPPYVRPLLWGAAVVGVAAVAVGAWALIGPVGSAPVVMPSTPEPRPPAGTREALPAKRLADVLADPKVRSDKRAAFTALYARWGVEYADGQGGVACETARPGGLECLFRSGTWNKLRRLALPAIVELVAPPGVKHYAAVTALGSDTATLEFADRKLTVPLTEIDQFWDGSFVVLWRAPAPGLTSIGPASRGKDVEWLRQSLAALDGQPIPTRRSDVYDDALRERVVAFQRSRSLVPDGIAGEETLTHLSAAGRDASAPAPRLLQP